MPSVENRNRTRDSLLLLATLTRADTGEVFKIRVRNLSSGGMMAEGLLPITADERVELELRNIGAVPGFVSWIDGDRFGMAFDQRIEPKLARMTVGGGTQTPKYTKPLIIPKLVG